MGMIEVKPSRCIVLDSISCARPDWILPHGDGVGWGRRGGGTFLTFRARPGARTVVIVTSNR